MKALIYAGPKTMEVRDVPDPKPEEGAIKIDVKYCGICGSDTGIFLGTHPRAKAPLIIGHEFVGTVAEDGKKFKKGDFVTAYPLISCGHCRACRSGRYNACNTLRLIGIDRDGGAAETIYVDEDVLFRIPDGVSELAAATVEPLAVIVRTLHQSQFKALDVAVVNGAGPIGMITGIMLLHCGASKVIISDIVDKRLDIARELGMTAVNPMKENLHDIVMAATDGDGCDILYECSGSPTAAMEMTDLTRVGGCICMTSVHKRPHEVDLRAINFKEQWMVGTRVYTKDEYRQAVELLPIIQDKLEKVVTHVVPIEESEKVFDMMVDQELGTCKIVVDCTPKG